MVKREKIDHSNEDRVWRDQFGAVRKWSQHANKHRNLKETPSPNVVYLPGDAEWGFELRADLRVGFSAEGTDNLLFLEEPRFTRLFNRSRKSAPGNKTYDV